MGKPVRFTKRQNGGYYLLCVGDKQPWAARLVADEKGEGVKFLWLKVRRARAEERALLGVEDGKGWAAIVETDEEIIVSMGRLSEEYHGKSGYSFHIAPTGISRVSRDEADEFLLHPSKPVEVDCNWDENGEMPF